jgi:GTP-binding protein HflX
MKNNSKIYKTERGSREKALLVLIRLKNIHNLKNTINTYKDEEKNIDTDEDIEELKNLAVSAGAEVEGFIVHNQSGMNPKYLISSGKLEEIKGFVNNKNLDLVIFNNELTATQQGNLEDRMNVKVIDRTALILDIFAQRAISNEGKLQVELAQLNYLLPRLRGMGVQLSRLGGGIGTRGPGEQKLEVDRRKIRRRINQLEEKVKQIAVNRETQRKRREDNEAFLISLVGYTNSGKSTVLNKLTSSDVLVKNMLFSTLDSTTRKLKAVDSGEVLLTDTVGFIEKLPHQLVMAFKSTLEEVRLADLLLIIIDASNNNFEHHIKSVEDVLREINVSHKPFLFVFNKIDKVTDEYLKLLRMKYRDGVFISALKNQELDKLTERIKRVKDENMLEVKVRIPYSKSKLISLIYSKFEVLEKKYLDESVVFLVKADREIYSKFSEYIYKDRDGNHPRKKKIAAV